MKQQTNGSMMWIPDLQVFWWLGSGSNRLHWDFQSHALPVELPSHMVLDANEIFVGFEPTTDCLTDNYSTN